MKRTIVGLFAVAFPLLMMGNAYADGTIPWTGNGSENTPCENGAHWVLAPAFGIESATLVVDDLGSFTMTQNGQGSWSVDTPGTITANTGAGVQYTGAGDERDHLQLSHCLEGSPSPTPTPTDTHTPKPIRHGHHHHKPPQIAGKTASTATTGYNALPGLLAIVGLVIFGTYLLRRSPALSRREDDAPGK